MNMTERAYKKMVKEDLKILSEKKKQAEKKEKQEQTAFLRAVMAMRKRMNEEASSARDERVSRNRAILRMHERMNREFMRKARDENSERLMRLEALKANDVSSSPSAKAKALYRRASAYVGRGNGSDREKAKADLEQLLQLQPTNGAARALLNKEYFEVL